MTTIELQKAIKEVIRDLGYRMNSRWLIKTEHHSLDNAKLGGWNGPQVWLDGHLLAKVTDEKLLEEALKELKEKDR